MKIYLFIICFLIIQGCSSNVEGDYFNMPNNSEKDISISQLFLDTLFLDSCPTSFIGEFSIQNGKICFMDSRYCSVFEFDFEGRYQDRYIGIGKGPDETWIGIFEAFSYILGSENTVFIGPSRDAHLFDKNWKSLKYFRIQKLPRDHITINGPPPTQDPGLYAMETLHSTVRAYNDKMYVSITTDHPYCNPFLPLYYQECPIIAQIDLNTGKWEEMMGRRSPEYLRHDPIGQHSFFSFDMDNSGRFYVNFEIDPRIYVYDNDFSPLYSFGEPGINMDTNYTEFHALGDVHSESNLEKIRRLYSEDRPKRGYYTSIDYMDEVNVLFRSYSKGQNADNYGLQVYKGNTLIGDVEVPENFKVVGYQAPFFYAQGEIEEFSEKLKIYRFKIPNI